MDEINPCFLAFSLVLFLFLFVCLSVSLSLCLSVSVSFSHSLSPLLLISVVHLIKYKKRQRETLHVHFILFLHLIYWCVTINYNQENGGKRDSFSAMVQSLWMDVVMHDLIITKWVLFWWWFSVGQSDRGQAFTGCGDSAFHNPHGNVRDWTWWVTLDSRTPWVNQWLPICIICVLTVGKTDQVGLKASAWIWSCCWSMELDLIPVLIKWVLFLQDPNP